MTDELSKKMEEALNAENVQLEVTVGPAVGIQLFLTKDNNGIIAMHDENENTVAQVQMDADQLQQMRDALDSMLNHMLEIEAAND